MTVKISDLAKKLELTSKEVVEKAKTLNFDVKTASSNLTEGQAEAITISFGKQPKEANASTDKKTKRGPIGKPITKAEVENRKKPVQTKKSSVNKTSVIPERPRGPVIIKKADPVEEARQEAERKAAKKRTAAIREADKKEKIEARQRRDKARKAREAREKENKENKEKSDNKNSRSTNTNNDNRPNNDKQNARNTGNDNHRSSTSTNTKPKTTNDKDDSSKTVVAEKPGSRKKSKDRDNKKTKKGGRVQYGQKSLEKKKKKKAKKQPPRIEPEIVEEVEEMPVGTVVITVPITVAGFCEQVDISVSAVIMALMKIGIVTNINASLDEATAMILAEELGINLVIGEVEEEVVEEGIEDFEDKEENLVPRSPIITVMGHVDHGKTSLLDAIRTTNVTESESGGITQHIGASEVEIKGKKIVFLDTPGHEAFTAMRARGADITDIAVLVVAADDGVKPQTLESISHAKAAGVPIIVALNKMDKPGADPDRVKKELSEHGILVEEWGGDVICVPVSAKTREGIVNLLEMILLQAEVLELKANPDRLAMGTVIEARLDKSKGPVATLLVSNGSMEKGSSVVVGTTSGRVRLMTDYKGTEIKQAGPSTAVEILGLSEVPSSGDDFRIVKDDKIAKDIAEKRRRKLREEVLARNSSSTLEELFNQIQEGEIKELNLLVKADVRGSVGAVVSSLEKLKNENVRVKIIHSGVGAITESDVILASTSGAIIIGFNVRPSTIISGLADRESVQIKTYRVIYNIIDDIENAMKGMLDPEYEEVILGNVEIRSIFKVPGIGVIGGAYVTNGKVVRNAEVRLVREGIVIHEGKISSLKRFKDDAKEVASGFECGIGIENYNDLKEGDIIECFQMEEIERK